MSTPSELAPGDQIKNYTLESQLGKGASGEVWKANDGMKTVALKLMNPALIQSASAAKHMTRLRREIEALHNLRDHPNIPTLYEYDLEYSRPYLAMQFIGGASYDKLIKSGDILKIPLSQRLHIIRELAMALYAAHSADIIHRDLKPANVSGTENPYLLDFSVALDESELDKTQANIGTRLYMPYDGLQDKKGDVYGFALVCYEIIFGSHAIFTAADNQLLRETPFMPMMTAGDRIKNNTWRVPSTLPVEQLPIDLLNKDLRPLDTVFMRVLGPHRDRYEDPREFVEDLRRAIEDGVAPIQAAPPPPPEEPELKTTPLEPHQPPQSAETPPPPEPEPEPISEADAQATVIEEEPVSQVDLEMPTIVESTDNMPLPPPPPPPASLEPEPEFEYDEQATVIEDVPPDIPAESPPAYQRPAPAAPAVTPVRAENLPTGTNFPRVPADVADHEPRRPLPVTYIGMGAVIVLLVIIIALLLLRNRDGNNVTIAGLATDQTATAAALALVPSATIEPTTELPTLTELPATPTPIPPTSTREPTSTSRPTATLEPTVTSSPTATLIPPSDTPEPTATSEPATATPLPPTNTLIQPSDTPEPTATLTRFPTATRQPTATRVPTEIGDAELSNSLLENLTLLREAISDDQDYQCETVVAVYAHIEARVLNEDAFEDISDYITFGGFILGEMEPIYEGFCQEAAVNGVRLPAEFAADSNDLSMQLGFLITVLEGNTSE